MAILVTGGAGYIGSHTCVELLSAGYDVIVLDNLSNSQSESLNRVQQITSRELMFIEGDIRDRALLAGLFSDHKIEAVVHFAGLKAVGESTEQPLLYYENNVAGTVTLCQAMAAAGCKNLVFSSSATVYGDPDTVPITEDAPLRATNPYGQSKLMIELVLKDLFASDADWNLIMLRYFNPVGAHQSGLIGENPNGMPNNLMPFVSQVAVGKRPVLNVFGSDYDTVDGTGVRDYIHVVDLAQGHLRAIEHLQTEPGYVAYNLGTGKGYSVLQMVNAFEQVNGVRVPFNLVDRRSGDIASCFADPSLAKVELDWQAEKGLEDMVRDAWNWQSRNPDGY